jgi:YHS domain-containing protein
MIGKLFGRKHTSDNKTAKDPICGMTVDIATALQSERDGKTYYFCSPIASTPLRHNHQRRDPLTVTADKILCR